ncbi:MAG: hypothetical protein P4L28_10805 [Paludibacteraceae bacterium]|nr:hypothetical protein [Paludibacteraceae bacterium]
MGLKKGQTGNPFGRPKGRPNRTTTELKEIINSFISNNLEDLQSDFDKLEPAKRFEVLDKMLKHVLPNKAEITEKNEKPVVRQTIKYGDIEIEI